ncbi:hypothetical protein BT69DRAFT_1291199 [Atractiella rhizophila]|nr:hypothetical protein BT69DRAFT_1291199 [Atractiella rhizophila]
MDRKGRIGLKIFADFLANEIYEHEITHPNSIHGEFLLAIKCYLFTTMPFPTPADTILWIDGWTKRRGMSRIRQLYKDVIEDNLTKARGNYVSYVRSQVKTTYNLGSTVSEIKKNVDFWLQDRHFLFARIDPFQHPAAKSIIADYFYHPNALGDLYWSTGVQIRPSQVPFTRKQRPKYTKFLESLERHQDYDAIRTEAYAYVMEHGGLLEVRGATSSEDGDSDY